MKRSEHILFFTTAKLIIALSLNWFVDFLLLAFKNIKRIECTEHGSLKIGLKKKCWICENRYRYIMNLMSTKRICKQKNLIIVPFEKFYPKFKQTFAMFVYNKFNKFMALINIRLYALIYCAIRNVFDIVFNDK